MLRHIDIARAVPRHTGRKIKPSGDPYPVRAACTARQSCQRRYYSPRCHFPDCVVVCICDIDVAGNIHCHGVRLIKPCGTPGPVRAVEAGVSGESLEGVRFISRLGEIWMTVSERMDRMWVGFTTKGGGATLFLLKLSDRMVIADAVHGHTSGITN